MRVNWILPEVSQCGGVRMALQYANILTELGHDVTCYAPKSGQHFGWKKVFFLKEVIRMYKDDELRGKWFKNKFKYKFPMWISNRSVRDADVTIATSWITSYWTNKLNQNKGKKVYFIQGFETWGDDKYNEIVKKSYMLPFDEYITVSTALHDKILRETGTASQIVCNGVEECFLEKKPQKSNGIIIGMPYRNTKGDDVKNCKMGIRVLLKIKEKYPDIELITFGFKKPDNWKYQIKFFENPSRSELVDFYNKTSIFYVPSIYEGWGLPAMEAMAQGNTVLAGKSGLIQEVGIDQVNCIILEDPSCEQEAIDKISALVKNVEKVKKIGYNARKTVFKRSIKNSCLQIENILCKLCENDNISHK